MDRALHTENNNKKYHAHLIIYTFQQWKENDLGYVCTSIIAIWLQLVVREQK